MKSIKFLTLVAFVLTLAPLNTAVGQTPSCSIKNPNTGSDCVSASFASRTPNSDGYTYHYTFTNTCERSFDLIMDTGTGQTRQKNWWIGRADSSGPKKSDWICIQFYNGAGDCQNIGWSYNC